MPLMSTGPTIFEVGTTNGDYQIISVTGRGGMGEGLQGSRPNRSHEGLAAGRRCASGCAKLKLSPPWNIQVSPLSERLFASGIRS